MTAPGSGPSGCPGIFGATSPSIHPTKHGFRIKGDYYQTNKRRNDHYSLTEDAVYAEID